MVEARIYKLLVEQARDYAVFMLDSEGRVQTWNLGAQRIKGYRPEEIIGRHFSVFYTPDAIARGWPQEELRLAKLEGRFEDEGWRVRKDGSRFWASVVITALRDEDGKLLGFSKITRDLTERKLQDEKLRQSEERFRLLVEGVLDYAIYMVDQDGFITSWNSGAERIKGYSREEILGKHFSRFYTREDIDAGVPWEELHKVRTSGRWQAEGWRIRKNGERFWARVTYSALANPDGSLYGFAKVTQDLSEHRRVEDLEKTARNMNEFIGMLAHELRNPLAPILTSAHAMAHLPLGGAGHEELRRTIVRQSTQLAHIVEDLVDISRITRGVISVDRRIVDMREIVEQAVETARPLIDGANHRLELSLPAARIAVKGDSARLVQVLCNLLNNSARYTPEGGLISVSVERDGAYCIVKVKDNGRGIEPNLMGRIFDMFVQGRAPIQRVDAGLGIGLALARRLAELHGGTLEASSEGAGKGSEFVLRVPVEDDATVPPPQAPAVPTPYQVERDSRRVLIVDDNVDAAHSLSLLLQSIGHETCVAHDGVRALQATTEFHPDVVLLDIGMPGLDGYEVARRLRKLRERDPVRIIAVTGWNQDADRQSTHEAGFDVHLVKPVEIDTLLRVLSGSGGSAGVVLH